MSKATALSISVGVFGMLSTLMTATVWNLPVWVLFLAWASFFFVGSGPSGLVKSVACNWTGIVIATVTLLAVSGTTGAVWLSIAVGIGSFAMVQVSRLRWVSATPAIVFGFAMTVGTIAATGNGITSVGLSHPALVAGVTALVGACFGVASEYGAAVIERMAGARNSEAPQPV
ncbi:DUF1097 domain-containing protein [Mycolicibacterium fluoranthenivorans]|jgi:hypothetical protein|uniref:DUF1097 domain-containing protein n=1 Tax=Mycolicibacterium fluoranthenivorans TaxID=258505 RepID=A0A1G4WGA9_9MYCO|nr:MULTISPECIES: DUF1097 domain-containing protein [Mycobacteriaceae]MCV7252739.1 DUF1097 domain-containing protein [Mycobacterium hackensackense]QNJ95966.1 DUF1097 domain-containing protein [Mycolicibacterium fluoranthenivorans]SCX22482.1 Protein of unknown function [Mycolicibacterium fluoranthenivorans]